MNAPTRVKPDNPVTQVEVAILGAGFGGLGMAIQLKNAGIEDFLIFEKGNEVGGTWRDNGYPGAACDVQSHLYSFSFEGNPDWSMRYSGWKEIQAYILNLTDKHELRKQIRLNTQVVGAEFDEQTGLWTITLSDDSQVRARHFVMASGPLHLPQMPKIKGLEKFKGKMFHSARWDWDYDMKGKQVASIGTGGSAIQYLPEIADQVAGLKVFQRTPAWVIPRDERHYWDITRTLFRAMPWLRRLHRLRLYLTNEARVLPVMHPRFLKPFEWYAKFQLWRQVKDIALREKLTPRYTIGCKRILVSNKYYPVFSQPNVELITDGIREITEHGVMDERGKEHKVDTIVLGTGFVTDPRGYLKNIPVTGLGGRRLLDDWKDHAEAYQGVTVSGYPNLYMLMGPNTLLGHNSVLYMMEQQIAYTVNCIRQLRWQQAAYHDVKPEVQNRYNEEIQRRFKGTVWATGCSSWYQQADGRNIALWPGTTFSYRKQLSAIDVSAYRWVKVDQQAVPVAEENHSAQSNLVVDVH